MTKMNTQNTLYAIDRDLNALYHFGVKGQKKRQHDPNRRWQKQAVYANGQPDPNAKERGLNQPKAYGYGPFGTGHKERRDVARANRDAKNDAAIKAYLDGGKKTYGGRRLRNQRILNTATGVVIGGALYGWRRGQAKRGVRFEQYMTRANKLNSQKVSKEYVNAYKSKFNDYYKKYSQKIGDDHKIESNWSAQRSQ